MFRLVAKPNAAAALAKVPDLRERVEETLAGIMDTALEIRRLYGEPFRLDEGYLRVRVAEHMISYKLDLDGETATVFLVERISNGGRGHGVGAA